MDGGNKIKVSLIVPAFNVELYLEECLFSLINQTLKEIEIILIDDGSTDQTGKIADGFAHKDKRIKVIHQENCGLAAARNRGMDVAKGDYIAFVDSDDWVKTDAYEHLYKCAEHFKAEVVLGSIIKYKAGKEISQWGEYSAVFKEKQVLTGKEALVKLMKTGCYLPMVYMNLYQTKLFSQNRLYFKYLYHEDEYFTPYVLFCAKRVVCLEEAFYYYRLREGSIMYSANREARAKCYIGIANELFDFVERLMGKETDEVLYVLIRHACSLILKALKMYVSIRENKQMVCNLPPLQCYKLNLWKTTWGGSRRLLSMYYMILHEQKKFLVLS